MRPLDVFKSLSVQNPTRAPSLIRLSSGVILAFAASLCDQKHSPPGQCIRDAKAIRPTNWMARSDDAGVSWSTPQILPVPDGYDVPTPIYDPATNTVHVLLDWIYPWYAPAPHVGTSCSRCSRGSIRSVDEGMTWSAFANLTGSDASALSGKALTHGFATRSGTLVMASHGLGCRDDCKADPADFKHAKDYLLRSTDGGATWHDGGDAPFIGECALAELQNGSLLLTSRWWRRGCREP
mgnify:CR=1 FL=1